MPRPSIAELRPVCHPPEVMARRNGEHWMSAVWARRASLHVTRLFSTTRVTADQLTASMILVGLAGAGALAIGELGGAVIAAIAVQLHLLLDCADGETARWKQTTSVRGAYLDRLGHYVVEAALLVMYGYHVGQDWQSGWVSIGLATGVLALIAKSETDLVAATGGGSIDPRDPVVVIPKNGIVRRARALTHPLKVHRWTGAIEATMLMVIAAVVLPLWAHAEQALALAFLAVSGLLSVAHAVSILSSGRFDQA